MNSNPLDTEFLSVDDVLLVPACGILKSRKDAQLRPFLYSAPMDTVTGVKLANAMIQANQYPVMCRYLDTEWDHALTTIGNNPNVFFAIGLNEHSLEQLAIAASNQNSKTTFSVTVDLAHGDSEHAIGLIKRLRKLDFIGDIMSGSICTPNGAIRCIEAGATHLRVGVGPGAACTTRLMTGCGVPQLSAIYQINKAITSYQLSLPPMWDGDSIGIRDQITIIADGGIRSI